MEPHMPFDSHAAARRLAAIELRKAAALRRDLVAGLLPRGPALSAARECLRHARACIVTALIMRPYCGAV